jgi:DNA-binding CsgD family transcriptional regulator
MTGHVDGAREAYRQYRWAEAYAELSAARHDAALPAEDLQRLATAAYLVGEIESSIAAWEEAHHTLVRTSQPIAAARSALWLAFVMLNHGEPARGGGWLRRAERALEDAGVDCVEVGFLGYCEGLRCATGGDLAKAARLFGAAARVGARFSDAELTALAHVGHGRCLISAGETVAGMALLDEAMASIVAHEISPTAVGDLYCTVIEGCQEVFDVRRAQEWTEALSRWCDSQPDVVLYRGQCLIHRAELMALQGRWSEALRETTRACERLSRPRSHPALGAAHYVRAELHRLRGQHDEASAAYQEASRWGRDPQPGLALLRLAQGRLDHAESALRRTLEEAGDDMVKRSRLLGPLVEISLAKRDTETATAAASDLSEIAASWNSPYLHAVAAYATGSVLLAEGRPVEALAPLRRARALWVELEAAHEAARTRLLVGTACRLMGDHESAELEHAGASAELELLGGPSAPDPQRLLTAREVEVLREVATGKTNRGVGAALFISEKTVATHVSSILRKLDLPSRAAATSYAHQHHLV